jgi:PHP family Zn ribbon phosphoesterase
VTLVHFYCPEHGYLCQASEHATVRCGEPSVTKGVKRRCNKLATTVNPKARRAA